MGYYFFLFFTFAAFKNRRDNKKAQIDPLVEI